jgi:hypothetical protein
MVGVANLVASTSGKGRMFNDSEMQDFINIIRNVTNLEQDLFSLLDYEHKKPSQIPDSLQLSKS